MDKAKDVALRILERFGITDPETYLLNAGEELEVSDAVDPTVVVVGNVQMMQRPLVSREDTERRLGELEIL